MPKQVNWDSSSIRALRRHMRLTQAEMAVQHLRQALLEDADNPDVKRNYELALKLLEEQQQQQQQQQDQEQEDQEQEQEEEQEPQENEGEPTPTPTPSPGGGQQPQPTPTPDPNNPLYAALERAENEAREQMRSPTPQAVTVEKDW